MTETIAIRCDRRIWSPRGKETCSRKATRSSIDDRRNFCTFHGTFHGPGWKRMPNSNIINFKNFKGSVNGKSN